MKLLMVEAAVMPSNFVKIATVKITAIVSYLNSLSSAWYHRSLFCKAIDKLVKHQILTAQELWGFTLVAKRTTLSSISQSCCSTLNLELEFEQHQIVTA